VEKVGNYLKEDLAKPGYKSKHESTKHSGWLEWRSHGLPTSIYVSLGLEPIPSMPKSFKLH
jgi:hypothetical protein